MATQGDIQSTQTFPNPPSAYYTLYTDENVESGLAPKPPKPIKGAYQMFGAPFETADMMIRPLEDQNIQRLYPQEYDRKAELKKLNRSILICFLELLDILINNPSSPERNQKISDISTLFINMHHLINEYRPHQARETLRVILERQKKQRDEMIQQIHRAMENARTILRSCDTVLNQTISSLPTIEEERDSEKMETENVKEEPVEEKKLIHSVIDLQDMELTQLINGMLPSPKTH